MAYTSQYPPAHSNTYVKATSHYDANYWEYYATDPAKSLTGTRALNQWLAGLGSVTNQRFHIDLGSAKVIRRIYYENSHHSGGQTDSGVQNFTFWGSNTGAGTFDDLVYVNDEGWTQLTISQSTFDEHIASDEVDPKYITVTNNTAYRYYAFKCADNYDNATLLGVRRIELQTELLKFSGTSVNTISTTGNLAITLDLTGTSANVFSTIAELTLGIVEKISGTSASTLSTIGAINLILDMAGASINAVSTTGSFNITLDLKGTSVNVLSATGEINIALILGGTSINAISTIGVIGIILDLSGTSENVFTAISTIELFVPIWTKVDEVTTTWLKEDKGELAWTQKNKGALDWTESVKSKSK